MPTGLQKSFTYSAFIFKIVNLKKMKIKKSMLTLITGRRKQNAFMQELEKKKREKTAIRKINPPTINTMSNNKHGPLPTTKCN